MKILQISSAEFLGGGERYLTDLANALVARGHSVYAVLRPNSPLVPQLSIPSESLLSLPLTNSLDAHSARRIASFVSQHDIDIVHAHLARDYPLAAYASSRHSSSRLIVTRHVLFPMNRLHKLTLRRVAKVIAVSEAVALQLRSEKIVPNDRIKVVLNGVDVARFEKARSNFQQAEFRGRLGFPANGFLIGTVGELNPLKGQEEFLQAAAKIAQSFPDAYFIVAGVDSSRDQSQRNALEELSRSLGISDRVQFVSWLDDIADLYCALDVFVSSSRAESFGLAMAEAMATGTAVVATATEGAKQLIKDEQTGSLVPVGNVREIASAVCELLADSQKRKTIGDYAKTSIRDEFSLPRMVDETEALYREAKSE